MRVGTEGRRPPESDGRIPASSDAGGGQADADQIAEVKSVREEALAAQEDEGPSLAEQISELKADIHEHTIQKDVIRRVLAAHGLSDDQVDTLLTDMEDVNEKLRSDDEDGGGE